MVCILHPLVCRRQVLPANIFYNLHTLVYRCHPTAGNINQGLNTSNLAYVHMASDISQWHAALARAFTCKRGMCIFGKQDHLMACDIGKGPHTRTWYVRIWQATSTNVMQHQQSRVHITCGVCTSAGRHHSCSDYISQATSVVSFTDRSSDMGQR